MQESERAGDCPVLIVDVAAEMAIVCARNQMSRGIEVVLAPGAHGETVEQKSADLVESMGKSRQIEPHEEALVNLKARSAEGAGVQTMRVQEKLRFNPVDARRILKQLDQALKQSQLDIGGRGLRVLRLKGEDVADHGFVLFIDAEEVACNTPILNGYVTGQQARIQILQQQIGGGSVIPFEALAPQTGFGFEQRAQAGCLRSAGGRGSRSWSAGVMVSRPLQSVRIYAQESTAASAMNPQKRTKYLDLY